MYSPRLNDPGPHCSPANHSLTLSRSHTVSLQAEAELDIEDVDGWTAVTKASVAAEAQLVAALVGAGSEAFLGSRLPAAIPVSV